MASFTYPGVYIEELSSGQHTITGVATSIAAFIGWAPQGPVTQATLVQSWAEYQATFGGLDARSKLGYAVNQFFANGGQQCYVVRLVWDGTLTPAKGPLTSAATADAAGVGYATATVTATSDSVSTSVQVGIGQPVVEAIMVGPVGAPPGAVLPPMPSGSTGTLAATPQYTDGSTSPALPAGSLKWTSSDSSVVAVDPNTGAVIANSFGTATITVTSGVLSGSVTLTVSKATNLTGLAVSAPQTSIAVGQKTQLTAIASYNDNTAPDVTLGVAWSPAPTASAVGVSSTGLVAVPSGAAAGALTATATFPWTIGGTAPSATLALTITAAVVTSAAVFPANPVLRVGEKFTANLWGPLSDGSGLSEVSGSTVLSSNPAVADFLTAGSTELTAQAAGSTNITLSAGGFTAATTVTVLPTTTKLTDIAVSPAQISVGLGLTQQMKATGIYSDGTSADLTTSVAFTAATVATFSPAGLMTTGSTGTASVSAVWQGVTSSVPALLKVTGKVLQSIQITSPPTSIPAGQTVSFAAKGYYSDQPTTLVAITDPINWSATGPLTMTGSSGKASATAGGTLSLFARNPGAWGNKLLVSVSVVPGTARFNVLVQQASPTGVLQTLESFVNLSVDPSDPNYAVTVIDNDSDYVTFVNPANNLPVAPTTSPAATTSPVSLSGGADGSVLVPNDGNFEIALTGPANGGYNFLDRVDIFNLLCIPGESDAPTISTLQGFCHKKRAFYIVDPPLNVKVSDLMNLGPIGSTAGSITTGDPATNSAFYFPWILAPDPLAGNRPTLFPPCGFVAGLYAATDASIGVWKAPAGVNVGLIGNSGLQYVLTDLENGSLNPQAVNCLRQFKTYGDVIWGARTLAGSDQAGSQWKYVPIRRLALFLESSLYEGTQWVVFEPNDETLWGQIRLNIGAFLQGLFLQGAFAGSTPQKAYFVKCDAENNPPASVALGVVNILVGFAPLYPAEFVVIQIQQIIGQS
ncbi:MAG TPA: Ig-like domain-containing protein [Polyangiaceae bacterium]|jgi:hypothetical protein